LRGIAARRGVHSRDEAVFAKCFLSKNAAVPIFRIELLVVGFMECFRLDADFAKQAFGDIAV